VPRHFTRRCIFTKFIAHESKKKKEKEKGVHTYHEMGCHVMAHSAHHLSSSSLYQPCHALS
jgi:hypothetical protein